MAFIAVSLCCMAQAQVNIVSKKDKTSDFPVKTMKVVLPGESFISLSLREAVKNTWTLSPYEFCTYDEFEALKSSDGYYFMLVIRNSSPADKGISFLTIVKGGEKKMEDMLELVTLPLCPSAFADGREDIFMPAILDVAQSYIEKSLSDGFKKIKTMLRKKPSSAGLVLSAEDLSSKIDSAYRVSVLSDVIKSDSEIASIMDNGDAGYAVAYVIAPSMPEKGASCWKMAFDARTHSLYYFKKSKIGSGLDCGLTKKEIKQLMK